MPGVYKDHASSFLANDVGTEKTYTFLVSFGNTLSLKIYQLTKDDSEACGCLESDSMQGVSPVRRHGA